MEFVIDRFKSFDTHIHVHVQSNKTASSWQIKEAEGTPQKQLPMPTTPMT